MAQKPRLAELAARRGEDVWREYNAATRDGRIDRNEQDRLGKKLHALVVTVKGANAAQALGQALERGVEDVNYLHTLVTGYQQIIDELPGFDAA